MNAAELAEITQRVLEKNIKERPQKLLEKLFVMMKEEAKLGFDYLDYAHWPNLSDDTKLIDIVLNLLIAKGYEISYPSHSVIRISWANPRKPKLNTTECRFGVAWVGDCKKPADETGFCEKHKEIKCRCGRQAVSECSSVVGPLVCGWPTCGRCAHGH